MKETAAETVDRAPEKNGDAASGRPRKRIKEKIDPKYLKISVYAVISVAAAFSLCLILFRAQPFFAGAWNLIKTVFTTGSTTYCVRGLRPWTQYVARPSAFDADGNESEPSEPISFMTNGAEMPLVIKLQ